jgi:hypothetical protein
LLYVAGTFDKINDIGCIGIAVWNLETHLWKCLYHPKFSFDSITAMTIDNENEEFLVAGNIILYSFQAINISLIYNFII